MDKIKCILCGSDKLERIFYLENGPGYAQKVFSKPDKEASKRVNVELFKCSDCEMVQIDPEKFSHEGYWQDYLNSRACTELYIQYDTNLADNFMNRYNLARKEIVEIGPGDGYFSVELKKRGAIMAGIEPSKKASDIINSKGIKCYNCLLDDNIQEAVKEKFNGFVCKQVMDLVKSPNSLLKNLGKILNPGAYGVIDVPSWTKTLLDRRYYSILPDRMGYYTAQTLVAIMERNDFHVLEVFHGAEDEYVGAYVYYQGAKEGLLNKFKGEFTEFKEKLSSLINEYKGKGKTIAAWGAGAKGITMFSFTNMDSDTIKYVIDKDQNRWNKYMSGSLLKIVNPDFLINNPVDVMIITAAMFYKEITRDLIKKYNFKGDIVLLSPTPHVIKKQEVEAILAKRN